MTDTIAKQQAAYAAQQQQELTGTGLATSQSPSWTQQQAMQKQQDALAASQAAAIDKATKARINWKQPQTNPTIASKKTGNPLPKKGK